MLYYIIFLYNDTYNFKYGVNYTVSFIFFINNNKKHHLYLNLIKVLIKIKFLIIIVFIYNQDFNKKMIFCINKDGI